MHKRQNITQLIANIDRGNIMLGVLFAAVWVLSAFFGPYFCSGHMISTTRFPVLFCFSFFVCVLCFIPTILSAVSVSQNASIPISATAGVPSRRSASGAPASAVRLQHNSQDPHLHKGRMLVSFISLWHGKVSSL